MAKYKKGLYMNIAQKNVFSDGLLKPISYTDYALLKTAREKTKDIKHLKH